ncbi:hypothetical protein TD95_000545 [Thielaviopsis punctulata]|uniref:1-phosphatidylinositol-4-phosphate 5-kinase n=1 Tax=Thielaviopsis punctulata TaxID=72032 RepID=A0A0F4Z8Y3_9PEZI|nr:hypothetical protein TD95_000545 [Thielaviopsis punctulata]
MPSYNSSAAEAIHYQSTEGSQYHVDDFEQQSFDYKRSVDLPHHQYEFHTEYHDASLHSVSTPTPLDDRFDQSSTVSSRLSISTDQASHTFEEASRQTSMNSMSNAKSAHDAVNAPGSASGNAYSYHDDLNARMASVDLQSDNVSEFTQTQLRLNERFASVSPAAESSASLQTTTPQSMAIPSVSEPNVRNTASSSASRMAPPTSFRPEHPISAPPPVPGAGLKQRHTLEVPKAQSNRTSRDSNDMAYTSGRFSPTGTANTGRRPSLNMVRRNTRSMQSDVPRDEVPVDEDARRWAEAVRQKRASKRRRKEEEDDDRVLVGTKVDEKHANWVTAYNMLTGIRVSVSRTNAKIDRELTDADFDTKQKSTFDIAGNELVPSAKYDFKFKDYAPWVFRDLRRLFRLDPADYLMSLTGKYILSEMGSPGKSGSFFYYSRDYKYIIKTIHHGEHKFLRHILKDYYNHVKENPNTLLSQFYGLHRVKTAFGKKIHFVVMNNIFPPHRDIHQTFDLKGSTIGRDYNEDDIKSNPRATLKDLNWMRRKRHLELGIQKKQLFMDQLTRDVKLLQRLHIMDYSLLVGVHDLSRGNEENLRDKTLQVFNPGGDHNPGEEPDSQSVLLRTPSKLENARKARELREIIRQERPIPMTQAANRMPDELDESHRQDFVFNQDDGGFQATHENNEPANEIYYLGVIDCLTKFGFIKKMEHFWKSLNNDKTKISAIPPEEYGNRFFGFIEGITMSPEEAQREEIRQQEAAEAAALARANERTSTWGSRNRGSTAAPPMPTQAPPPPPPGRSSFAVNARIGDENAVLPVVHESGESSPSRGISRDGQRAMGLSAPLAAPATTEFRPQTPRKDFMPGAAPPTPPKSDHHVNIKPDSSDSGYCPGPSSSHGHKHTYSQQSVDKDLPPLPPNAQQQQGPSRPVYV